MSKYDITSDFEDLHSTDAEEDNSNVTVNLLDEDDAPAPKAESEALDYENDEQKDSDLFDDIDPDFGDDDETLEVPEIDEEEEEDEEVEDQEDDDDQKYSKNVKKRIDRERRRANRERDLRQATQKRLDRIEARQDARANEDSFRQEEGEINGKLADLRKQKAQAIEEGDTDLQIDLDDQMLDLKADLRTKRAVVDEAKARLKDIEADTQDGNIDIDVTKLGAKAQAWINAHPEFETDPKFRRAVLAADNFITTSGSNPNTAKHYEKLEGLIAKDYPDYFPKAKARKRNKPAVTEGGRKSSKKFTGSRRRGKVVITSADKENMRRFGLDPSNSEHLRNYAANKED